MEKAYQLYVYGRVQGVGFRYLTKMLADQLKLSGMVKNLPDSRVYIEVQGPSLTVSQFISAIKSNPSPAGRVDQVDIKPLALDEKRKDFVIYYYS